MYIYDVEQYDAQLQHGTDIYQHQLLCQLFPWVI